MIHFFYTASRRLLFTSSSLSFLIRSLSSTTSNSYSYTSSIDSSPTSSPLHHDFSANNYPKLPLQSQRAWRSSRRLLRRPSNPSLSPKANPITQPNHLHSANLALTPPPPPSSPPVSSPNSPRILTTPSTMTLPCTPTTTSFPPQTLITAT